MIVVQLVNEEENGFLEIIFHLKILSISFYYAARS